MRGYDRDEVEDYNEYEDYDEEQEGEGEGEEEQYEEEERKPSAEELEYLELRERIKEQIRKKRLKENGNAVSRSQEKKKKLPLDNYGSFFGPSQPVIAQRVIQESKSLLENPHLAFRVSKSNDGNKKSSSSTATGSKNGVHQQLSKVTNELKTKVQKLKDTRDYSFLLSDDVELPAPTKEPAPRKISAPKSEMRSTQLPQKSKQPSSNNGRNIHGGHERKSISINAQMHAKAGPHKSTSASKPNLSSVDPRRHLGSNNGIGPGRPAGPKGMPSKMPVTTMEKKTSAPSVKNILPAAHKSSSSRMQSSVPKQHLEQKRQIQEPNKAKMMPKQQVASSKPQINKPVKHISSHVPLQHNRTKKKPVRQFSDDDDDDEGEKALSMIRRMFNTQRFAGRSDDDSDMEANFDDIMREEKRSARIAKEEDDEQLRLIEEEERRERMRKLKKRKLSQ